MTTQALDHGCNGFDCFLCMCVPYYQLYCTSHAMATMGHAPTAPWVTPPPHHGSCTHPTMGHAPTPPWVMHPLHHNIVPRNPQATFSFEAVCGSMTCRMSSTSWPTAFPTAPRSITKLRGTFEDTSSWGTWVRFFRYMHACTGHTVMTTGQCTVQGTGSCRAGQQLATADLPSSPWCWVTENNEKQRK